MKKIGETTKEAIIESAIVLFNAKGFEGTSIRDIARQAKVNVANISYYFQGKKGLLEECLVKFFEQYLACLEAEVGKLENHHPKECLLRAIKNILQFQSTHYFLSRFVWREITIDSQMSREIISTYLMKERYFFKSLIQSSMPNQGSSMAVSMTVIQLKGMLMMPYLNIQYVQEVWNVSPQESYFVERYYTAIKDWIDNITIQLNEQGKTNSIVVNI